jgi:serine/threonine protein kinase
MIGTQVGSYRIEEKLGEGGMGTVYRATEINLDRTVAIKVLNHDLTGKASIVDRFRAEAKAQANLNHHNVAILYAFLEEHENAMMVMEFVDGENLQQLVVHRGAIPAEEAIPLFKQALAGIGAAHDMGIVHRDIKPANIMINSRGVVKVMDFGIAKVVGERGLTRTGVQLGTVYYMSPEQVKGKVADPRSDIYALGVTLYEILTGHVPFDAASEFDVLTDHVHTAPPPPTTRNAGISKGIEGVVLKALEKKPEDRFQNVTEFAQALDHPEAWADYVSASNSAESSGTAATMELNVGGALGVTQAYTRLSERAPDLTRPPPEARRAKSFWTPLRTGLAAFAVILLLGLGALVVFMPSAPPKTVVAARHAPAAPAVGTAPATPPVEPVTSPPDAPSSVDKKPPEHIVIPAKTAVHVHLASAIMASAANENEVFPVVLDQSLLVQGKEVLPKGGTALIVLTKTAGSKKSPKVQFQLSSIRVSGKTYKVKSDTFEFNNSTKGKRAGKLSGIGSAMGALVGGKRNDAEIELPTETEMMFTLKAPVTVNVDAR